MSKRISNKQLLLMSAALSALNVPVAYAQQSTGIETVIVSAERRDQSIQDVPSTVQAFTGQALSDLNVTGFDDLLKFTPNVTYGNNGPGQGEITMRGLSNGFRGNQSSGTIANFPNVALYLDDQSMQFPARNLDIYVVDMDRIEVLEGPQGTLFGGGAEAGAVRYITNKPKLDIEEGRAEASYSFTSGGDPNTALTAMINVPIIDDKLAVRVVIYDDREGGYIDNVPSTFTRSNQDLGNAYFNIKPIAGLCPNKQPAGASGFCALPNAPVGNNQATAGNNFNPAERDGARASALFKIDDDWNVLISESLQDLNAQGVSVEFPVGSDFQPLKPYQVTSFSPSYNKDKSENTAWTINGKLWDLKAVYTGGYTVRNVSEQMDYSNYTRTAAGTYYTCSGGTTPVAGVGPATCYSPLTYWQDTIRSTHFSNEVRISSPDDWRLRFITGAYEEQFFIFDDMNFNYKNIPSCNPVNLSNALAGGAPCLANLVPIASLRPNDPSVRSDSTAFGEDTRRGYAQWAGFVSVDYDIIPDVLTATAGTRWYQYQEFETGTQYGTDSSCLNVPNGHCGDDVVNIGNGNDRKTYAGFKSRANITWHVTPDVMVYGTWSQGFRPGGFNRSGGNVAPGPGGAAQFSKPLSYAPDSLVNNEVGVKGEFFDHRLQVNLSAYYMIWDNVQFLFFNPTYFGNTTFGLNGPNFDDEGVEAQFVARVADGLTVQGSGDYDENTVNSSRCLVGNIAGTSSFGQCITQIIPKGSTTLVPLANPFGTPGGIAAFSPKYQANIRARYDWEMDKYNFFASVGASFTGSMYNQPSTYADGSTAGPIPTTTFLRYKQPAYTTFDAAIGVSLGKWSAQIYGSNLGGSDASTFTSSAQFIKSQVPLRPRVVGLKVGFNY